MPLLIESSREKLATKTRKITKTSEIKKTIEAETTLSVVIFLLKALTSWDPRILEIITRIKIQKVVTRIPPPVEAGAEPININKLVKNVLACESCFRSKVKKPVERDIKL